MEGYEESTLWDISSLDVSQVGVKTLAMIARMPLADQTSMKAMVKEITRLKRSATQFQAELGESVKNAEEDKKRSLDELKTTLEV